MNDDRRNEPRRPSEQDIALVLAALARLPRAVAAAQARERARMVFVQGGSAQEPASIQAESRPRPRRRWASVLMAAALGVLAIVWFGFTPDQDWVVLDAVNSGGLTTTTAGTVTPGTSLAAGRIATGPKSELEIQLGDQLRFRMVPGTSLDLPRAPGRWFGRDRRLTLAAGEIYGTSGGRKLDFGMIFATEELEATLTGTTFAVFRTDTTSCVCLWKGGVAVQPLVGPSTSIVLQPEQRVWVYKDGRQPVLLPLSDMEVMKLQMIHDAGLAPSTTSN